MGTGTDHAGDEKADETTVAGAVREALKRGCAFGDPRPLADTALPDGTLLPGFCGEVKGRSKLARARRAAMGVLVDERYVAPEGEVVVSGPKARRARTETLYRLAPPGLSHLERHGEAHLVGTYLHRMVQAARQEVSGIREEIGNLVAGRLQAIEAHLGVLANESDATLPLPDGFSTPGAGPATPDIQSVADAILAALSGRTDMKSLYRAVTRAHPGLGVGAFQDALRALATRRHVHLEQWEGSLADIPDRGFALFLRDKTVYHVTPGPRRRGS